jgi:hypothetical protein
MVAPPGLVTVFMVQAWMQQFSYQSLLYTRMS